MRTVLICHDNNNPSEKGFGWLLSTLTHFDDPSLNYEGMGRWLVSFSDLAGIVVLRQKPERIFRAVRHEIKRVGYCRFIDVLAFRLYYRLKEQHKDKFWEKTEIEKLRAAYPKNIDDVPKIFSHSPNTKEVENFIKAIKPDIMIARCKELIKEDIFSIPLKGTFVTHYGICPEYRGGNGCFWALANNDPELFGMTLLKIDKGVDTGPVYGYYSYPYNELKESHIVMGNRVVFDNLELLKEKLIEIFNEKAQPITTSGRRSRNWGQPWLTKYLKWRKTVKKRSSLSIT